MKPLLAGFEDYLPLLIFIAIWWLSSKKKKAAQRRPAAPPATPSSAAGGEGFNLQDILRQLLTGEVEMPRPVRPPGPVGRPDDIERRLELEEERDEPEVPGEKPPAFAPPRRQSVPVRVAPGSAALPPCRRAFTAGKTDRRTLRRAMIWSEILGPPVSLRD